MVAKHSVKVNGVWYRAGEEITPAKTETKEKNFLDEFAENIAKEEFAYTKTEINRMSTADLKKLATSNGIDKAEDMSGSELKKVLIERFGL